MAEIGNQNSNSKIFKLKMLTEPFLGGFKGNGARNESRKVTSVV